MGHGIVPTDAGWEPFIWLLTIFIIATIASALSLQFVIERFRALGHWTSRIWTRHSRVEIDSAAPAAWSAGRLDDIFTHIRGRRGALFVKGRGVVGEGGPVVV